VNGSTVARTVQIQATATDNVGVTKIELYIDGQLRPTTAATSPLAFSWNTTNAANGSHTLVVKAYDLANNVGSASVSVSVSNTLVVDKTPPSVAVTNPLPGRLFLET
jgi:hypothetical protein